MKAVCSALGVAGSHVCVMVVRLDNWDDGRSAQSFHQAADAILVEAVGAETTALLTHGYLKAGALVNRTCAMTGLQTINHKRFCRVMKAHSLLLTKALKRPDSGRMHDGVVAVAEPNQRWCSDCFQIPCDNGEVVTGGRELCEQL